MAGKKLLNGFSAINRQAYEVVIGKLLDAGVSRALAREARDTLIALVVGCADDRSGEVHGSDHALADRLFMDVKTFRKRVAALAQAGLVQVLPKATNGNDAGGGYRLPCLDWLHGVPGENADRQAAGTRGERGPATGVSREVPVHEPRENADRYADRHDALTSKNTALEVEKSRSREAPQKDVVLPDRDSLDDEELLDIVDRLETDVGFLVFACVEYIGCTLEQWKSEAAETRRKFEAAIRDALDVYTGDEVAEILMWRMRPPSEAIYRPCAWLLEARVPHLQARVKNRRAEAAQEGAK